MTSYLIAILNVFASCNHFQDIHCRNVPDIDLDIYILGRGQIDVNDIRKTIYDFKFCDSWLWAYELM